MMAGNCQEMVALMSEPGGTAQPQVRAHLEACPACREVAATLEALYSTAQSPSAETLGHFATRVRGAHLRRHQETERKAPARIGLFAGLCAAAGAAAVALVLQLGHPTARRVDTPGSDPSSAAEVYSETGNEADQLVADFESVAYGDDAALASMMMDEEEDADVI